MDENRLNEQIRDALSHAAPDCLDEILASCEDKGYTAQLADGSATVQVLPCEESWYGVTYQEDLDTVRQAIERMEREGTYPETLWG